MVGTLVLGVAACGGNNAVKSAGTNTATTVVTVEACTNSEVSMKVSKSVSSPKAIAYNLVLTNISSTPCSLGGYPGVSYVKTSGGAAVGAAATQQQVLDPAPVTVATKGQAHATVSQVLLSSFSTAVCQPVSVAGFKVQAPKDTHASFVPLTGARACSGPGLKQLTIGPLRAGG